MTASWKAAASWPLLTFALWACCLLQIRCEPAPPQPIDAAAPAVLDMNAPQLLDLMPVAPACVLCSWTEPYMGCDPSLCARQQQGGQLCCVRRRGPWPTGRRRFRKMNRRFRQRGPLEVRERARRTSAGRARKMILVDFWGRNPLPLPPRPFSPASLVGMSQSARKRLARKDARESVNIPPQLTRALIQQRVREILRVGKKFAPCGCWYWGDGDCELCGGQRIVPVKTPEQRRQHRRRERSRIAWNHSGCAHDIDEWLDAGRECPSKDEHGVCNEIPF